MPSGYLLMVCLFLPALKPCSTSEALPMVLFPFVWPPYLVGLFIALAAAANPDRLRTQGVGLFMLIRVSAVGLAGSVVLEMLDGQIGLEGLVAVGFGIAAFAVTWRPPTEVAVAGISILAATGSFAFTLVLAHARLAVWGADLAAFAAGGLVLGALWWFGEALWARRVARVVQTRCTSWR